MKYDIVTIGDASEDIFIRPEGLKSEKNRRFGSGKSVTFELGEKIPVENVDYAVGGSACNTAVGFSRMGFATSIISALGDDYPADKILEKLEEEGVNTSNIVQKSDLESHFSVIMNVGLDRTIFVHRGLKDYSLLTPKKSLNPKWFYLGPMGDDILDIHSRVIEKVSQKNAKVAWNPGSHQIDKKIRSYKSLAKNTNVLFLNRSEAMRFLDVPTSSNVKDLLKKIHIFGPKIIVITKGKGGAECFDGKRFYKVDSYDAEVADVTGAGDSFACGFLSKLIDSGKINRDVIEEALKWGIFNSSSVIEKVGAQTGLLSKDEVQEYLEKNPRFVIEVS